MPDDARRPRRGGVDSSLRTALVWESVLDQIAPARDEASEATRVLRVLDIGGGTGGMAVPLAELGHDVLVVDPSPDALAALDRRAADAGVSDRVRAVQGDTTTLSSICPLGGIDLVCCHGVLEVVDDPAAAVGQIAGVLAPGGLASIVVAQRLAAILSRALAGKFAQARHAIDSPDGRWGEGDPLPRRFDAHAVEDLVESSGLQVVRSHGVRILSDLVPSSYLDGDADRAALLDLERAIAADPHAESMGRLAAAWHVLARKV